MSKEMTIVSELIFLELNNNNNLWCESCDCDNVCPNDSCNDCGCDDHRWR